MVVYNSRFYYTLDDLTDLVIYMEMKLATKNSLNTYSIKRVIRFIATKYIFYSLNTYESGH